MPMINSAVVARGEHLVDKGVMDAAVISDSSGADSTISDEMVALRTADSDLQSELDSTQTGAGLGTGGAYTANASSNYLTAASSLVDADNKLDAQAKTNADAISTEASARVSADSALQSELDATQSGAGLGTGGSYTANASSNYLTAASSLVDADNKLDAQVKTNADGISTEASARASADSALQSELDATQSGAGLGTGGSYTADASSNYLGSVSTLFAADIALDGQIKSNADAISTEASTRASADTALGGRIDDVLGGTEKFTQITISDATVSGDDYKLTVDSGELKFEALP